jgi:hypothetical protein
MKSDWIYLLAAFVGAIGQEISYWYDLRAKLTQKRYQILVRSPGYWVVTLAMTVFSAVGAWLLYRDDVQRVDVYLLAGAAFPLLFKKLVAASSERSPKLGREDSFARAAPIRTYFNVV